ncbi:MAG: OmpA family protein [Lewinellaceae bacterium]|nr:OmpA family protein [Saprospiraceae bacterium]MCB9331794.1 OmpA family protein [Lewinellaceae bacterium]
MALFFPGFLISQNLVINPGFEQLQPQATPGNCQFMHSADEFNATLESWTTLNALTPDLHRANSDCPWLPESQEGNFCVGLIHFLPAADIGQRSDYHEIIQGQLRRPLQPGLRYRVEIWVREDSKIMTEHMRSVYASNTPVEVVTAGNLGFYFLMRPLKTHSLFSKFLQEKQYPPQVNFSNVIRTDGAWVKLSATFVPDQPFQYFLIGNFFSDAETANSLSPARDSMITAWNNKGGSVFDKIKRAAYICLDQVSVTPEPERSPATEPTSSLEKTLLTKKRVSFSAAVLFDSGKADLRAEAYTEIDQLLEFMQKYPAIRIGIAGHTDDVGTEAYNLELSARRARAVFDYLVKKGIPENRLDWKAFGETRPVAENVSEAGRQQNRRVECIILQ